MLKEDSKKKRKRGRENGFEAWGGYMNAKISKLEAQFNEDQISVAKEGRVSGIFSGISIFVNGYTEPPAEELRCLMLQHGGVYHHYYRSGKTTHIIASSLPNAKFDQMKTLKVVKCEWITESIKSGKLLDYKNYLLQNDFPSRKENVLTKLSKLGVQCNKYENEPPKTAADDGYINDYYKNSRLHYISSLGLMLKQFVQEMRENQKGIFPGRKHLQHFQENVNTFVDMEAVGENVIMHIDMDCFFVSVALRNYPHLKGQPVAVTHSRGNSSLNDRNTDKKFEAKFYKKKMKAKIKSKFESSDSSDDDFLDEWAKEKCSMSEIASCSYEARKAGVSKGMYLGMALKRCPNLKTVPYDFEGYKEVSLTLYRTVANYTLDIEAVSCDELFINCDSLVTELKIHPIKFAEILRAEIEEKTSCTSSVGIGANKLQAKLATKHAKPNGQFYLTQDKVGEFMRNLDIRELPGVGRTISARLKTLSIKTCGDLQNLPLAILKKEFGEKTGEALYEHSRGEDHRKVNFSHERKSVSAEVNYGIRFNDDEETETFLKQLSEEVSKRLKDAKMIGKNITLKIMFRAKDAPVETAKFLGHGACDQITRSVALPAASDSTPIIARQVIALYHQFGIPANELRGIGIHVTKLECAAKTGKTLQDFLNQQNKKPAPSTSIPRRNLVSVKLPTASQIDPEVLHSLPEDVRDEVLREYGLTNLIPEKKEEKIQGDEQNEAMEDESFKQLFSLSLSEMRTMIREWVATETRPRSYDVDMLKSYLSLSVEKKKLETVSVLLQCLNRHINSKREGDEAWKATHEQVVVAVQSAMKRTFGKELAHELVSGKNFTRKQSSQQTV